MQTAWAWVQFGVKNSTELMDAARVAALKDAQKKAALMANTLGYNVGRVKSISESYSGGGRMYTARIASADRADEVPVAAGREQISVSVVVVFEVGEPCRK